MNVIKNFINSEKAVAVGLLVVAASVLAALGHMTIDQWMDYTKWMATVYVGGKALQGAAATLGKKDAKTAIKTKEAADALSNLHDKITANDRAANAVVADKE